MHEITPEIPLWTSIPFIIILLSIAIGPLLVEKWWEHNKNKFMVSAVLCIPVILYMTKNGLGHTLIHTFAFDYVPFIILLGTLFVVTGGIHLSGDIKATPRNNLLFLATGFVLASVMGTTGAAMLLIRPLISTNQERKYVTHTILFFIALVANCGGLLTPLGDPPLFMLYLRGVEFSWFLKLFPEWIATGTLLLTIYYFTDKYFYKKESWVDLAEDAIHVEPIRITGTHNFLFLIAIVLTVAFANPASLPQMSNPQAPFFIRFIRELILLGIAAGSLISTSEKTREKNNFLWSPVIEVAALFIGIFITMTPTLILLSTHAANIRLRTAGDFMYASGGLSSFLDNTPTAIAFYDLAAGMMHGASSSLFATDSLIAGVPEILIRAICVGAVFFGAMTYIGNGPNFMVKSIAEQHQIKMPGFFAYMYKFSLIVLLPVYILIQLLFLH